MRDENFILVDWGTSNFRAWLVDGNGRVLDRRISAEGILAVPKGGFEAALSRRIGPWRIGANPPPILMSGMIGSRQGWVEAPYVECPATLSDLAGGMIGAGPESQFLIAPGVSRATTSGHFDVMRGEEVQIFGAAAGAADAGQGSDGLYCLPGTHSKWAMVEAGRLTDFTTYMTGEVFALLCAHSILGRLMGKAPEHDPVAFDSGFARALEDGGLLAHLFSARADVLFGAIAEAGAKSYLSGILIGHELRDRKPATSRGTIVNLIGASNLVELYGRGLAAIGLKARVVDSEAATIRGLLALARLRQVRGGIAG